MNNSFARLMDGMCETLRAEVLTRLRDDFARGQVYGVINLLNTLKVRADWSPRLLLEQIDAQARGLSRAAEAARELAPVEAEALPAPASGAPSAGQSIEALLATRDANNRTIGAWLAWLDATRDRWPGPSTARVEEPLREAMRAEVDLELRFAPRPLFAEMSSGREG
jgi:hypothetical protein